MRLQFHDFREVLQGFRRELEDVAAATRAARLSDLLESTAQLLQLTQIVVCLELQRHEVVVGRGPRKLNRTRVAVQVLRLQNSIITVPHTHQPDRFAPRARKKNDHRGTAEEKGQQATTTRAHIASKTQD